MLKQVFRQNRQPVPVPTKPFALSAKAIIRDDQGRYLLVRRSAGRTWSPGKWEFPGGKVESGETFDRTLLREVAEETGLAITLLDVAGAVEFELPTVKVVCLIMETRCEPGQVRLSREHDAYVWVEAGKLLELDLAEPYARFSRTYQQSRKEAG